MDADRSAASSSSQCYKRARETSEESVKFGTPSTVVTQQQEPTNVNTSSNNGNNSRDARFADRHMPDSFHELLGEAVVPDEAKDLEDMGTTHYADFADLPLARREALMNCVQSLARKIEKNNRNTSPAALEAMLRKAARMPGCNGTARKSELTVAYRELVRGGQLAANTILEELLIRKRGKSHSGVLVITVFMGPSVFSCPKDCHYCPNQPGVARSYLLKEPAVLRGFRDDWDPIRQFYDRASALENNGHVVDKIELIILGGTFSFYPVDYVHAFITASFYAANTYYASAPLRAMGSLQEEITANEEAACRIIGITIETRPDYITNAELRRLRTLGVTRVQLGIQHLDDDILNLINRDCPTWKTVQAIQRLLDAGFKVDAHWMPDLPGSSYEKDREMFETLFSQENESFQVDQWKVYPTATVPFTKISEWYAEGKYKPYAECDNGAYMVKLLLYIMEHCPYRIRLNRIVRDIPSTYIIGGEKRCNLRQVLQAEMTRRGIRCHDIRERECKGNAMRAEDAQLFVETFRASGGTEYYLSIENAEHTQLYGHLRLRLRDAADAAHSILPVLQGCALIRELHTYGKLIAVHAHNTGAEAQHVGVGSRLMREAEQIAKERGFHKVAVIAGVGVRRYYAKLGYHLEETYMVKSLESSEAIITAEQVDEDDDNDNAQITTNSSNGGLFATVKRLFGF